MEKIIPFSSDPLAKKKMIFLFSSLQVRIIFVNSSSIGDAKIITLTNYSATKIVYLQMIPASQKGFLTLVYKIQN